MQRELDAWLVRGCVATLWWRDDDAAEAGGALERLLALAVAQGLPLCLAVIPARASCALARHLAAAPATVAVLQHGFAHRNYAAGGAKKIELGGSRPTAAVLEELARGAARLRGLFGPRAAAILVPPWNRIDPALVTSLSALGFTGLSAYGARRDRRPMPHLVQVNAHADVLRWRAPRGFLGAAESIRLLAAHLRARRTGAVDADEPTGLLTHHLAHDEACWGFLAELLPRLAGHPAVRFLGVEDAFAPAHDVTAEAAARGAA